MASVSAYGEVLAQTQKVVPELTFLENLGLMATVDFKLESTARWFWLHITLIFSSELLNIKLMLV